MKKFILFFVLFTYFLKITAQPCTKVDEIPRKYHKTDGCLRGHPYTMFDRHNDLTLQQTIENIRNKIKFEKDLEEKPVFKAYEAVYSNAILPMPTDNGMCNAGVSELAAWAKNNAFVFLIGLDAEGLKIDSLDSTFATRNAFKDRAYNSFDYLTGEIDANNPGWGWWVVSPSAYFGANLIEEEKFLTKIKIHCCATQFYSVV